MSGLQSVILALLGGLFGGWIWEVMRLHRILLSRARAQSGHPFPGPRAMAFVWRGFFAGRETPEMRARLLKFSIVLFAVSAVLMCLE